eukprot:5364894-Amphidinium_carterae.1
MIAAFSETLSPRGGSSDAPSTVAGMQSEGTGARQRPPSEAASSVAEERLAAKVMKDMIAGFHEPKATPSPAARRTSDVASMSAFSAHSEAQERQVAGTILHTIAGKATAAASPQAFVVQEAQEAEDAGAEMAATPSEALR